MNSNILISLATVGENIVLALTGALGSFWYLVLVNAVGVGAICVKIIETQNKNRNKIVLLAIINYILWITYFILNGDFTSATVNTISCVQLLVFIQRGKYKWADSKWWLALFFAVQFGACFLIWKGPFSLFSITAGFLATLAYFVKDVKIYRYLFLALILLWIGNGIVYFYPIALIHDTVAAISIIIAIIKYNILGKQPKEKANQND